MAIPYISTVAALIGDPTRAYMLCALKREGVLSASELASLSGVAASTASEHLAKLLRGNLVECESRGRQRFYRLSGPEVSDALEALEYLSVTSTPMEQLIPGINRRLRFARVCYDHLGGQLAVDITKALLESSVIREGDGNYDLTASGERAFRDLGIDLDRLRKHPRILARRCLDWTEKQPHMGGALGAAVFRRFQQLDWIVANPKNLDVTLTPEGRKALPAHFGLARI